MVDCRLRVRAWRRKGSLLVVALSLCAGCLQPASLAPHATRTQPPTGISQDELRGALNTFEDFLEDNIKQAASEIEQRTQEVAILRAALLWKLRVIPACQTALKQDDPLRSFVDCWNLAVRQLIYLTEGDGRRLFGPHQQVAVTAAQRIEADIERIGATFLPPEKLEAARKEVRANAASHPMRGEWSEVMVRLPVSKPEDGPSAVASILSLPLAPFRTFEGIDRGATAIHEFADVAARFTDIIEEMPESLRWQIEFLVLELNRNPIVTSFLASLAEVARSSTRIASAADALPEKLRVESARLIDEIDARQGNLQDTLDRAERTAATVERALERVDVVAASIDRTGVSVAAAGQAWEGTARQIGQTVHDIYMDAAQGSPPAVATQPAAPSAASSSFDINDYRKTADALTATATELRGLVIEARGLIESQQVSRQIEDLDGRIRVAIDRTSDRTRSATDHAAWRVVQIVVLVFLLVVAYRVAAARLTRPRKTVPAEK